MKKRTLHLIALMLSLIFLLTLGVTSCSKPQKTPPPAVDGNITPIGGTPTGVNIVNVDGTPVKDVYAIIATIVEIAEDRSWFVCNYDGYRVVVTDTLEDTSDYTKNAQIELTYRTSDLSVINDSYVIDETIHICIK